MTPLGFAKGADALLFLDDSRGRYDIKLKIPAKTPKTAKLEISMAQEKCDLIDALAGQWRTTGDGMPEAVHRRQLAGRDPQGLAILVPSMEDRKRRAAFVVYSGWRLKRRHCDHAPRGAEATEGIVPRRRRGMPVADSEICTARRRARRNRGR